MAESWGRWDIDEISKMLSRVKTEPEKKYFFTDSQDEFIERMEGSAARALESTKDNLRYLEQLDKIRQVKEGAKLEDVYPWLKKDKDNV